MNPTRYPFKLRPQLYFALLAFAGMTGFFVNLAMTNVRPWIIDGIRLTASQARIFLWVMAASCLAVFILGLMKAALAIFTKRVVVIGPDSLTMPKGSYSTTHVDIPYASIQRMEITTFSTRRTRIRTLHIHHVRGKHSLNEQMLADERCFDEVCASLNLAVGILRRSS